MSTTNVNTREPSVLDYASPVQFRFKCSKLPTVEFFCQTANIPGISLGQATVDTPLKSIPFPGDELNYQDLGISFLVLPFQYDALGRYPSILLGAILIPKK